MTTEPTRRCAACNEMLVRRGKDNASPERLSAFGRRRTCNTTCSQTLRVSKLKIKGFHDQNRKRKEQPLRWPTENRAVNEWGSTLPVREVSHAELTALVNQHKGSAALQGGPSSNMGKR